MPESVVDLLEEIGFTKYEAKIYAALVSHGSSGVSDINRFTGIPRNKVYETLEVLAKRGFVENRPGRPVIFRAISPKEAIGNFVSEYNQKARDALGLLLQEEASGQVSKTENVWLMSTNRAIKQRLADEITKAQKSFFGLEAYPPEFLISVKSVLKAAAERGVAIRAMSIIDPLAVKIGSLPDKDFIHYQEIQKPSSDKTVKQDNGDALTQLRQMSRIGGSFIIDDMRALNVLKNQDDKKITGILIEVPAIPALQRISLEKFVDMYSKAI